MANGIQGIQLGWDPQGPGTGSQRPASLNCRPNCPCTDLSKPAITASAGMRSRVVHLTSWFACPLFTDLQEWQTASLTVPVLNSWLEAMLVPLLVSVVARKARPWRASMPSGRVWVGAALRKGGQRLRDTLSCLLLHSVENEFACLCPWISGHFHLDESLDLK